MTRVLDILGSLFAIVLLSPLLVVTAIALKFTGEHDVFYRQTRVGRGGRDFGILKFATMLRNSANMHGGMLTLKDDPRVLPLGKFLRKTKINELPQLFNILVGEMSFVGPRPQARSHYELYSADVRAAIDAMRPGLTGIGSLVFRDEEDMLSDIESRGGMLGLDRAGFHDRVIAPYKGELEKWYAAHRTLGTYFALIALTAWAVVRPRTSAHRKLFKDLPPVPDALKGYLG